MAESYAEVTTGSGLKWHTWSKTVGANTVHDGFVLPGEYPLASYVALGASVSLGTANDHILALMAGSALNLRIRRIRVEQSSNATTAAAISMSIYRLSTAGTGGTAITPAPLVASDGASGATARTLPSSKGTETTELFRTALVVRQAVSATSAQVDDVYEWVQHPGQEPIVVPAGPSNGIAVKNNNASTTTTVHVTIEFVEASF